MSAPDPPSGRRPADVARAVKESWAQGAPPDAHAALLSHPELRADKAAAADLAHEEFCQRTAAGEVLDRDEFCALFPSCQTALRRIFEVQSFFAANPGLLPEAPAVVWPEAGQTFGNYTLRRELGRGGFARVFLATEASTGARPVVVKLTADGADEAHTLGRLNHPNVVPVWSAGYEPLNGLHFVCMPFLGSATLDDLRDRAFPKPGARAPLSASVISEAVAAARQLGDPTPGSAAGEPWAGSYADGVSRLGAQLADGLAYAHSKGILHRDLKPSNVLLTPDGRAVLLDFNLSARVEVPRPRLGGTLPYMAPELVEAFLDSDRPAPADPRSDLYSLGVILYELLTGTHPFGPVPLDLPLDKLGPLLQARQWQGCRPLRAKNARVGRALAALVERCLEFDPACRPARAEDVAAALRALLPTRRRWLAAGLRVGATAVAAGVAGYLHFLGRPPRTAAKWCEMGWAAVHGKDLKRAEECFREAVVVDDGYWEGSFGLGSVSLARGEQDLAAQRPDEAKGALAAADGHFRHAEAAARRRSPRRSAPWEVYAGRGRALLLLDILSEPPGDFFEARSCLRAAVTLSEEGWGPLCAAVAAVGMPAGPVPVAAAAPSWVAVKRSLKQPLGPLLRHGSTLACLSYCEGLLKANGDAIAYGKGAIACGFKSVGLLNNLAYNCLQLQDLGDGRLRDARGYLNEAVAACRPPKPPVPEPTLLAVYRNRAYLSCQEQLAFHDRPRTRPPNWRDQAAEGIPDFQEALAHAPAKEVLPADLYRLGAQLYALAALLGLRPRPAFGDQKALECPVKPGLRLLHQAHKAGALTAQDLERPSILLKAFGDQPAFDELRKAPPAPGRAPVKSYLVDPIVPLVW